MNRFAGKAAALVPLVLLLAACGETDAAQGRTVSVASSADDAQTTAPRGRDREEAPAAPRAAKPHPPDMRLEVNLARRELYVFRRGEKVATHPVAVGSEEWPTPVGEWTVTQAIWNPRWIPPRTESWAADEEVVEPGDPRNPLGRAQLVYRAPNSVHGTIEPESLGKAVSHGSIRVSNDVAMSLARQVMEAGGAGKKESWYRAARTHRRVRREVVIPNPVPIRIVSGE